MPTGYTAKLEELDWNLKKWLTEDLVRGLGVCVSMRDNGDMTRAQIIEGIKTAFNPNTYDKEQLEKAEAKLKLFKSRNRSEWKKVWEKETQEAKARYENDLEEKAKKSPKYKKALRELEFLRESSNTEAIQAITKFALDQLNSVKDEFEPSPWLKESYERLASTLLSDFIKSQMIWVEGDVQYYKGRIAEYEVKDNRLDFYMELIQEVDKHL